MTQVLYGFHAVGVRLKIAPASVLEVHVDAQRRDARMRRFVQRLEEAGARVVTSDDAALARLARNPRHQGVVAKVMALKAAHSMDDVLDGVQAAGRGPALVLALDGVTDPHNLGACLRSCDGAGAHLVIAPRDRAVGLSATVSKVASGAAESVPYLMVTNLARTLGELKERGLKVVGACDDAPLSLHEADLRGPMALVLGAEGSGMRALTRSSCDELVRIPMRGAVESLNVSVAAAVCLYEVLRQRSEGAARAQAPISPG